MRFQANRRAQADRAAGEGPRAVKIHGRRLRHFLAPGLLPQRLPQRLMRIAVVPKSDLDS